MFSKSRRTERKHAHSNFITIVCRPNSWRYALCALGRCVVETAESLVYTARMLRLRECPTTKKKPVEGQIDIHLSNSG